MKQSYRKFAVVLLCAVLAAVAVLIYHVVAAAMVDGNAVYDNQTGAVIWNGVRYVDTWSAEISGTTKVLSRMAPGEAILEIAEDPDHTFVAVRQHGSIWIAVREDYKIPQSGKITAFLWGDRYIDDEAACAALQEVMREKTTTFTCETEGTSLKNKSMNLDELYIAYDGCPVATYGPGYYMGTALDRRAITAEPVTYTVDDTKGYADLILLPLECYEIPAAEADVLFAYFG